MTEEKPNNVEALKDAGVIHESVRVEDLPEDLKSFIESLSDEQLAMIMLVNARLKAVRREVGEDLSAYLVPL
jgi:hypothetical protein